MSSSKAQGKAGEHSTVTVIASHVAPAYGLETVALKVIDLLQRDFSVKVVCIGGNEDDLKLLPQAIILGPPLRGLKRLFSVWRLWRYARTDRSDHIILTGLWVALPWLVIAGRKAKRSVVWEHTLLVSKFSLSKKLRLLAFMARILYPRARDVVAVSDPVARDLARIAPRARVTTIYNPFDCKSAGSKLSADRPRDKKHLVAVGSLTPIKSQSLIIRALSLLDERVVLSIIGSGPELTNLQKLTDELGLASRVRFEGFLSPVDVAGRLVAADALVHCSAAETFGMVYMEAAEVGLAVVSTRSDMAELLIPKYVPGIVCEATPEALAAAVNASLESVTTYRDAADAASHRKEAFSPEAVGSRWNSLLLGDTRNELLEVASAGPTK